MSLSPTSRGAALPAAALAATALAFPGAEALATPPGGPKPSHNGAKVKLSKKRVEPGGRIRVHGTRFPAARHVSIKLDDDEVGVIAVLKVNRHGRFRGSVRIPANVRRVLDPGRHWLRFLAPASKINRQSSTSVKKTFRLAR